MNKFKKIIVASVMFSLMATPVFGTTAEDLAAQIAAMQTQLNQLMAQYQTLTGTPVAGTVACTFTRNLYPGVTGEDVKCLQQYLNGAGHTVAATGVGSAGNETMYFGSLTQAAVKKWQDAVGVAYGTYGGYFGPVSRAKFTETATTPVTPDDDDDEEETTDDWDTSDPTEGTLDAKIYAIPGNNTIVSWGVENEAVMGIEFEAKSSAVKVNRIDLTFSDNRPWDWINYVTIFDGTKAVKGMAVNSTNAQEVTAGGDRYMRFTGLDIVVPKDGKKVVTVKVNTDAYPRERGTALTVSIAAVGDVRGTDTMGLTQNITSAVGLTRTFTTAGTGEGAALKVKSNAANPEEGIIIVDADTTTEEEVLRFDVEVTKNAAKITQMVFAVSTTTGTLGFANVTALRLYDGDTVIGSQTPGANVTFANLSINVAKDATKTFVVKALHAATTTVGDIRVSYTAASTTAQSANGETVNPSGAVTGNYQYFYGVAPGLVLTAEDFIRGTIATTATAYIEFTVTAMGGNIYIDPALATTTADSTASTTSNSDLVAVDGADQLGSGFFVVYEGQTKKFRMNIAITSVTPTAFHYAYINRLAWGAEETLTAAHNGWTFATFLKNLKTRQNPVGS